MRGIERKKKIKEKKEKRKAQAADHHRLLPAP